jgi:hypothetical protein
VSTAFDDALARVRAICAQLPEVSERQSHGSPGFFVRDKRTVLWLHDNHHGDDRMSIWCAAPEGVQAQLIDAEPERFFSPPYVGKRGWLGVRVDVDPDWDEIAAIIRDAYRCVAPAKLARLV